LNDTPIQPPLQWRATYRRASTDANPACYY
jgi:hypothetical protein